jgi:hypothetical protein
MNLWKVGLSLTWRACFCLWHGCLHGYFALHSQSASQASDAVSEALHPHPPPAQLPFAFTPDEDDVGGVEDTVEESDHSETAPPPPVEVQVLHIHSP